MPKTDRVVPGTTIKESSMEKMLRHNREIVGGAGNQSPEIDHNRIAESLESSQPVLLPGIGAPRVRATRMVERVLQVEGVAGTSPTPGQDNIDYVPPTTSNTADPANVPAKGPDAENEPATRGKSKAEQLLADVSLLFQEGENPFAKKNGDGDDNQDDNEGKDGKDDNEGKDGKDGKDKDDKDDDKDDDLEEAVEVHCAECGYEEQYLLSEASIAEGNVPLTPEGKLDNKCPMCGADMDMSMIGATNQGEVTDPNPRTDARGNTPQRESVSSDALNWASALTRRVVEGESLDEVAGSAIEGDFMERKSKKRQPTMAGAC